MRRQAKKAYSGGMSIGSRKRLGRAVTIMAQGIKPKWQYNPVTQRQHYHQFSFITLTVASTKNITHREAYDQLLCHFLGWMTRTVAKEDPRAKTYIWKAELQKRGQIHYHITTPAFIHWREIRRKWNQLQREAGLLDDWAKEHGNFDPNGTDVHDTHNVRSASDYMVKELCKSIHAIQVEAKAEADELLSSGQINEQAYEEQLQKILSMKLHTVGKVWGCSENLSGVNYWTIPVRRDHEDRIATWIKEGRARQKIDDYYSIVYCDDVDPTDMLSGGEQKEFSSYLRKIFDT
jgi:hypothetical protein